METTDSWSDMAQPCDMDLWVMKRRSVWPMFHGPGILPFILKTIWCMYIILWEYDSVWHDVWPQNKYDLYFMVRWVGSISRRLLMYEHPIWDYELVGPDVWPQNKCRSLWPIFHGPLILRYILKTIWCMNIILRDYGSVWPDIWPKNKCRSVWPVFHGPVILSYISNTIWCMSVIFSDKETVWPKLRPQSKYKSTWPIFHGLVILLNIFKIIWWMNIVVGVMD